MVAPSPLLMRFLWHRSHRAGERRTYDVAAFGPTTVSHGVLARRFRLSLRYVERHLDAGVAAGMLLRTHKGRHRAIYEVIGAARGWDRIPGTGL